MIISHRGRNTNFGENTLAAFDKVLELGAQGIECDLRLTLDKKIVVCHDKKIKILNKKVLVSKSLFKDLNLLSLDELFIYIQKKPVLFFLEAKSSSKILVESIIKKIQENDLWDRVHIIGFSFFIRTTIRSQAKYPKLKVLQIINIPLYSYIRKPAKSYGVMIGWFDSWHGSAWIFRKLIPVGRLIKLRKFYVRRGFKVMAGVINRKSGFKYFQQAGIEDIISDNISGAVNYFKHL